jgi:hypothetical protein
MREALCSLMCVGDWIKYIYRGHGGYHIIIRSKIVEIRENEIVVQDLGICDMTYIEHYNGELYVWERAYIDQERKIEDLIEIIKSKETYKDKYND